MKRLLGLLLVMGMVGCGALLLSWRSWEPGSSEMTTVR